MRLVLWTLGIALWPSAKRLACLPSLVRAVKAAALGGPAYFFTGTKVSVGASKSGSSRRKSAPCCFFHFAAGQVQAQTTTQP